MQRSSRSGSTGRICKTIRVFAVAAAVLMVFGYTRPAQALAVQGLDNSGDTFPSFADVSVPPPTYTNGPTDQQEDGEIFRPTAIAAPMPPAALSGGTVLATMAIVVLVRKARRSMRTNCTN